MESPISVCVCMAACVCVHVSPNPLHLLSPTHTHTNTHSPVALLRATSSCYHGDDELAVHHHDGVMAQLKVRGREWHGVGCV